MASEHEEGDLHADAPFHDHALRAYLNALPDLLKRGHEDQWFVCDDMGNRTAVGKTQDEARQNYIDQHSSGVVLEILISSLDYVRYHKYFEWRATQNSPGLEI
jgi:hypothetical protein